jgi:three-Cys-motif partner protein
LGAKKTGPEKLQGQLKVIGDFAGKDILSCLKGAGLGPCNTDVEYGPHTMLKLSYLNYYLGFFLRIAYSRAKVPTRRNQILVFDRIVFVDMFAGSGIARISGSGYPVLGSPLLAAIDGRFDEVIAIEGNLQRASLLQKRAQALGIQNLRVICGDSNVEVKTLPTLAGLSPTSIVMLFVDPEGMEPQFASLLPLMTTTQYVDTMMNYTFGVRRLQGRIEKHMAEGDVAAMTKMIPNYVPGDHPDEALAQLFETYFGKPIADQVDIHSKGSKVEYSMILRLRRTQTDSEWVKSLAGFGSYLSSIDGQATLHLMDVVSGRQSQFSETLATKFPGNREGGIGD